MGINTSVYTYYGIKTDWNDAFYTEYEAIEEANIDKYGWNGPVPENDQIEVLVDGMIGEYFVFGIRLYDSGDFRWCSDMNDYQEIDLSNLKQKKEQYITNFASLYPDHVHLLEGE